MVKLFMLRGDPRVRNVFVDSGYSSGRWLLYVNLLYGHSKSFMHADLETACDMAIRWMKWRLPRASDKKGRS